jgi:hypothetical protein
MRIDAETAVVVCAGPSLDRMSPRAWAAIGKAGAVVAVNGAAAAVATSGVTFTCIAAMDFSTGLADRVPSLAKTWRDTPAWRVASTVSTIEAESYIVEVDEEHGVAGWSDDGRQGYMGGSTGMIVGNWLGNPWPDDAHNLVHEETGKRPPRRAFRKLAYVGLDMHRGDGVHALGAGNHRSGFADSERRYDNVCRGWEKFCGEAAKRGVAVVNFTPGTGLAAMPRAELPEEWVSS